MLTSTKVNRRDLRKLMADRALTSVDVAKILGVQPQTVRAFMCGVRKMNKPQLEQVQSFLRRKTGAMVREALESLPRVAAHGLPEADQTTPATPIPTPPAA